jgi:DNA polymerase/3'-5' exonuclease PolX
MKLQEAERLAFKILQVIEPCCENAQVAGSVRRRRLEVHDIDIVVIPKPFMWGRIPILMRSDLDAKPGIGGPELIRMYVPFANSPDGQAQVDFYAATAQTWGVILLIRTGSTDHNIRLCTHAKALGMMLSASRGVLEKGMVIASKTEEEIFKALILPYVAPGDREI